MLSGKAKKKCGADSSTDPSSEDEGGRGAGVGAKLHNSLTGVAERSVYGSLLLYQEEE
jgi:hypothetical protein